MEDEIVAESQLRTDQAIQVWTPSRVRKYLRRYSLGPGKTAFGNAKNRYRKGDVTRAYREMLAAEPRDATGRYTNPALNFLQSENCL